MGNIILPDEPIFSTEMTKIETTTPVSADLMNKNYQQLLNNDAFLKALGDLVKVHFENAVMHVTEQQKAGWNNKAEKDLATTLKPGLMSALDKVKSDAVNVNAEENQNAFSNVKVGESTVSANSKEASIEFAAGTNIYINGDNSTKKITIHGPSTLKSPGALAIQTNGTTQASYDGSTNQTVNITPAGIGLGNVNNTADANKSVSYAETAGNAQRLNGQIWSWSGQGGQPTWVWGGSEGANMYVYNPANFSVASAASAATINGQTTAPVAIQEAAPATNCLWVW